MKKIKTKKKRNYSEKISLYPMKWYEALGATLKLGDKTEKKKRTKVKLKRTDEN